MYTEWFLKWTAWMQESSSNLHHSNMYFYYPKIQMIRSYSMIYWRNTIFHMDEIEISLQILKFLTCRSLNRSSWVLYHINVDKICMSLTWAGWNSDLKLALHRHLQTTHLSNSFLVCNSLHLSHSNQSSPCLLHKFQINLQVDL